VWQSLVPRGAVIVGALAWHRTLRRAGVRLLAFPSLRHAAVSLMIASEGLNPKQLQSVIGHASIQLTYDTYGHLMPDSFEGLGSGLDAALRGHGGVTGGSGTTA
jgi:integrase